MRLMDYEHNKQYSLKDIKDQNKMTKEDKDGIYKSEILKV